MGVAEVDQGHIHLGPVNTLSTGQHSIACQQKQASTQGMRGQHKQVKLLNVGFDANCCPQLSFSNRWVCLALPAAGHACKLRRGQHEENQLHEENQTTAQCSRTCTHEAEQSLEFEHPALC
jgi:hypothetical protein